MSMDKQPQNLDVTAQFEQCWNEENLALRKRMLIIGFISEAVSSNNRVLLSRWISRAVDELSLHGVEELLLQTLLFVGFPKTIEAFATLRKTHPGGNTKTEVSDPHARGLKLSKKIYGDHHDKLMRLMDQHHPDLRLWMIQDGYGKILSRPGLTTWERELSVLVILMSSGMHNQFRAHFRGALYAGVSQVDIIWFTNTFQCIIAAEHREAFQKTIQKVFADEKEFLASQDARQG